MRNVPDDWDCYWSKCFRCGKKYHESEGGCGCEESYQEWLESRCIECNEEEAEEDGLCAWCYDNQEDDEEEEDMGYEPTEF